MKRCVLQVISPFGAIAERDENENKEKKGEIEGVEEKEEEREDNEEGEGRKIWRRGLG